MATANALYARCGKCGTQIRSGDACGGSLMHACYARRRFAERGFACVMCGARGATYKSGKALYCENSAACIKRRPLAPVTMPVPRDAFKPHLYCRICGAMAELLNGICADADACADMRERKYGKRKRKRQVAQAAPQAKMALPH